MVNLALIGCGGMAHWHAQQLQKIADARVIALADPIPAQTALFKTRYFPDAAEFAGFEALAVNPPDALDAVVIVTPHAMHYSEARTALKRGWHVLVEKPMVTRSADAYDLATTVRETGKFLAISFQAPYTPEFGYLAAERDAGRLGKIQLASAFLSQSWLSATRNSWRQIPALSGGGQMYDSGAHTLNSLMWLLNDPVIEVACFYERHGAPVDIDGVVIAKFQSGAMASVSIGGNCPPFRNELFLQTDRMLIQTDQYGAKLDITGDGGKRIYPHVSPDTRPAGGTPHLNFVSALLGREKLRVPVRYGVLLSALMDALYESADTGAIVRVNPVPNDI